MFCSLDHLAGAHVMWNVTRGIELRYTQFYSTLLATLGQPFTCHCLRRASPGKPFTCHCLRRASPGKPFTCHCLRRTSPGKPFTCYCLRRASPGKPFTCHCLRRASPGKPFTCLYPNCWRSNTPLCDSWFEQTISMTRLMLYSQDILVNYMRHGWRVEFV